MPPLLQTAPRPTNGASAAPVTVREDTPWPGAGKMLGNLFVERNWALPKDYLAIEDKKEDATVAKPPSNRRVQKWENKLPARMKKSVVGDLNVPFCKAQKKDADLSPSARMSRKTATEALTQTTSHVQKNSNRSPYPNHKPKGPIH